MTSKGPDGSSEKIQLALGGHEVCAVTPTSTLTPYETEYEGYMGNYGNTPSGPRPGVRRHVAAGTRVGPDVDRGPVPR